MSISPIRRAIIQDHEAYLWSIEIDGVRHDVAWWAADGTIRMSFPMDGKHTSRFVNLGPDYSPRHSLRDAVAAVSAWAKIQRARIAS